MIATTQAPRKLALYGVIVSTTILAIALLAMAFTTGPTEAQSKTYKDPQPCGQGQGAKVTDSPVDQITTGKIALFDAYWDLNTETINNNLCPPSVTEAEEVDDDGNKTVTTTRASANIDIAKTVIHVTDDYKATVVADNAGADQISLAEYPFLRVALDLIGPNGEDLPVPLGTQVYWLRLDDPDTTDVDETSNLVLGFSTALFDEQYWETRDGKKAFQYLYASERDDIYEEHGPHFFAFGAPQASNSVQTKPIWSSVDAHVNEMELDAGEKFQPVQWVFTEPGTHHIQVNVNGQVRQEPPQNAGSDWARVHPEEKTSNSQVRTYTFQSGPLNFNQQPMFQVERSVTENAASGTNVGVPVSVVGGNDGDTLTYGLSGRGSSHFDVVGVPGGGAQVTVASGALLDYEAQATYDLVLESATARTTRATSTRRLTAPWPSKSTWKT